MKIKNSIHRFMGICITCLLVFCTACTENVDSLSDAGTSTEAEEKECRLHCHELTSK